MSKPGTKPLNLEVEITNPKLRKHIKRGWVSGASLSMGSGSISLLASYPWWYRWFSAAKRFVFRVLRRKRPEDMTFNPSTGVLQFKDCTPKVGDVISVEYEREE